ncbi:E3 ubiquitin-protein ligase synoviolin B-like [Neltuma alba]|uniref:E3 ubiquitin-protein ligase synoviolin B-like n=1 Tax=Neltuma alba TaxID=207710 RepID=UPI0010A463BC|nr:E3 ubiquitin-protein ligase synoviolin B-like [Prosopis alba]
MESHLLDDSRIYECKIHSWGEAPYYIKFDFLDGNPALPPSGRCFNIRTFLEERYYSHASNMHLTSAAHTHAARYDFFNISIKSIKQATNYILSILNVPEKNQKSMAQQILNFVENMANNTHPSFRMMFMIVMVNADIFYHNNDNCDQATEISMKDQLCLAKLASEASNNKLKGVKLQQEEGLDACPICLEDFRIDAVQMPCSHFFHGNCIVNWLLKKNNCPICRLAIPSSGELP